MIHELVFDHFTLSDLIERIGQDRFPAVFNGLNEELLRLGLLAPVMSADYSPVKANVNSHQLSRCGLTGHEFRERAARESALSVSWTGGFILSHEDTQASEGTGRPYPSPLASPSKANPTGC